MRHNKYRFIFMILLGACMTLVLKKLVYTMPQDHSIIFDFAISILITILVWEGNLRLDAWLNQKVPWMSNPKKRLLYQFFISTIYSSISIYSLMTLYDSIFCNLGLEQHQILEKSLTISITVSLLLLTVEISYQFFKNWKNSLLEIEGYKAASAQAQLQSLKEQINPHFLFNNLSVLTSLVHKNQDKAVDFINQLAKVYRYLLESKNHELVTLQDELTFIDSYNYLLQIRFDKSLSFQIEINEKYKHSYLPPMCLQMLVENAIKHNEVSIDYPLHILIKTDEDYLIVSNNLQKRTQSEQSSKTGLKNIEARYEFFTAEKVLIRETEAKFEVSLPLISKL